VIDVHELALLELDVQQQACQKSGKLPKQKNKQKKLFSSATFSPFPHSALSFQALSHPHKYLHHHV
jgi:hypothetical protein